MIFLFLEMGSKIVVIGRFKKIEGKVKNLARELE